MGTQAAGEQTIAIGNMDHVPRTATSGADRTSHHRGPGVDVVLRVTHYDRLAGRATGGVHAHDLAQGNGEKTKGIGIAQILFHRKRKLGQIFQALQIVWMYALGLTLHPVVLDLIVGVAHRPLQPFHLQGTQLVPAGGLDWLQSLRFIRSGVHNPPP